MRFSDLLSLARADPAVVGVVLTGSQAREGMATVHSDHDVYVIVAEGATTALTPLRSPELDLAVVPLTRFREPETWNRYSFVHCQLLLDRGEIASLVAAKARLSAEEARQTVRLALDDYVNSAYRSMKSHRDGLPDAAHLDAAESVAPLLTTIFALHGRVRPFNKYLRWELERHPLGPAGWAADPLLPQLRRVTAGGDAAAQRALFACVEPAARAAGHGDVLDAWDDDLEMLRP